MASETTVVSDHSSAPELLEKVNEVVKKINEVDLAPSNGSGEEEKPKVAVEKIEDKQIEPSLTEEVKKTNDAPVSEVPAEVKPDTSSVPEPEVVIDKEETPTIESKEKKPKELQAIEAVEKQPEAAPEVGEVTEPPIVVEQPPVEVVEKELEEQPKMVETLDPSVEAIEKLEEVESLPVKEPETVVMKDAKVGPKNEEIADPVDEVVDKPQEEPEAVEKVKKECEEIPKPEETLAEKIEETSKEEAVVMEKPEEKSEVAEKVEKECKVVPKEIVEEEIAKPEETLVEKIEEISKEEPVVMEKPEEPSEVAEKVEKECEVEPKAVEEEIAKPEETLAEKIEEPVVIDKPEEPSEAAETVEKECEVVEPKETEKVESAKDEETLADKIEEPVLNEEKMDKEVPVVVENPKEESEAAENFEKECETVEPKESVEAEIPKVEETLADKIKEEPAKVVPQVDKKEDEVKSSPIVVAENAITDEKEKENENPSNVVAGIATVVGGLLKEEVAEPEKVESDEPKADKVADVSDSVTPTEVTENFLEGETASRDIDLVAENGKESIKEETVAPVETEKIGEVEEKVAEVTPPTLEVPEKFEAETGEKEAGNIAKPDVPPLEPTKDGEDAETTRDLPKEEVPVRPTSKHSNNLIAKVKQSLSKAKKAIIGKSPNSKTVSSETKGDVKDK